MDSIEFLTTYVASNATAVWDLVFIDDWHSRDHVKKELELLSERVTQKGLILLHDLMSITAPNYNYDKQRILEFANGGVYYGLADFIKNSGDLWEWSTIPVCHGLTLLRKRDKEPLSALRWSRSYLFTYLFIYLIYLFYLFYLFFFARVFIFWEIYIKNISTYEELFPISHSLLSSILTRLGPVGGVFFGRIILQRWILEN